MKNFITLCKKNFFFYILLGDISCDILHAVISIQYKQSVFAPLRFWLKNILSMNVVVEDEIRVDRQR